jgi:hypothetical protein
VDGGFGFADGESSPENWTGLHHTQSTPPKDFGAHAGDDLHGAIRRAMDLADAADAVGWLKYCGFGALGK